MKNHPRRSKPGTGGGDLLKGATRGRPPMMLRAKRERRAVACRRRICRIGPGGPKGPPYEAQLQRHKSASRSTKTVRIFFIFILPFSEIPRRTRGFNKIISNPLRKQERKTIQTGRYEKPKRKRSIRFG